MTPPEVRRARGRVHQPLRCQHARTKPSGDQPDHPPVAHPLADEPQQQAMIEVVKERADVGVHYPEPTSR